MITCTIEIREIKDGLLTMDMRSKNDGSELERMAAGILDIAISSVWKQMHIYAGNGTMVEGKDIDSIAKIIVETEMKKGGY